MKIVPASDAVTVSASVSGAFIVLTGARLWCGSQKADTSLYHLSPSNKTVIVKVCAPVNMKQPVSCPIFVPDNSKEQKERKKKVRHHHPTHTHKHAPAGTFGQNFIQVVLQIIQTKFSSRISVTSAHSVKN